MIEADRVAIIGWIWFIAWTIAGHVLGRWVWGCPGTGIVVGFLFALATLPAWPWIIPPMLDDWMHELPPPSQRHHHWLPPQWREHAAISPGGGRDLKRIALVAALWFLFWMTASAIAGAMLSKSNLQLEGAYDGFFNGAWWALLTSFAWPWFMPAAIDRWMYRSELG